MSNVEKPLDKYPKHVKSCIRLCNFLSKIKLYLPLFMISAGVLAVPCVHFLEGIQCIKEEISKESLYTVYWISLIVLIVGIICLSFKTSQRDNKNNEGNRYLYSIVLIFIGVAAAIIVFLWKGNGDLIEKAESYYWMIVSIITSLSGLSGMLEALTKHYKKVEDYYSELEGVRKDIKKQGEELMDVAQKIDTVGVWTQDELLQKVSVKVYNMDDYVINLPFLLSQKSLKAENLEIKIENRYTDEKAIEEVANNGGFAIVDPYYVKNAMTDGKQQLVILSPLVVKNPIRCLKKEESGNILVYDKSPESTSGEIFAKAKEGEGKKTVEEQFKSLEEFVKELLKTIQHKLDFWENVPQSMKSLITLRDVLTRNINEVFSASGKNEPSEWYEIFIHILALWTYADTQNTKGVNVLDLKKLELIFKKYSKFYLMEPELTMIQKVVLKGEQYTIEKPSGGDERSDIIFTAIITTTEYLRAYPLIVLKFLKAIRVGILRCHSVLNARNSGEHSNSIDYISSELEKNYLGSTSGQEYRNAVLSVLKHLTPSKGGGEFDIKDLYPEDLVIFGSKDTEGYTIRLKKRGRDLSNFFLNNEKNLDEDFQKKVKFIESGLGI
ncbi:hypothetical protein [Porphyromonas gingivalis]|uniref:hypothetical protein n=1 Tax=Porphyromonas gingivalis TaxID=837 RepID=UPI0006BAD12A|nr:hypothetical protein [Porphyromonas gingivalis]ATS05144.1 hypothetical protein CS374_09340 [Porphyromonas gingivalis]PDP41787.1 hypothetical protein CLI84_03400 [Porphyromonas gingivalis]RRG14542.1 hypothetical protein DOE52_01205 [Porphyromonas gingivalis]